MNKVIKIGVKISFYVKTLDVCLEKVAIIDKNRVKINKNDHIFTSISIQTGKNGQESLLEIDRSYFQLHNFV